MKLNKILSMAVASVLAISAVSSVALAAEVPVPKDDDQAFEYAESLYFDGLYYEARMELDYVNHDNFYNQQKKEAWLTVLNQKIERYEISVALDNIRKAWATGDIDATQRAIDAVKAMYYNMDDFYAITYWQGVVDNARAKKNGPVVTNGDQAIGAVKARDFKLASDMEWYVPVYVGNYKDHPYDVYIVTNAYGKVKDVAAFNVYADGDVKQVF